MAIALLATGDEIVHGDTLNTNAHHIAHTLSSEGLPLGMHMACSDKECDLFASLNFLTQHHDIVIIIGGLGPTSDDITRFVLAKFTQSPLVEHALALNHVHERLRHVKIPLTAGNLQQCLFPETAQLLPNPNGSALGCAYKQSDKLYILLPGPPKECLPMFHNYALPLLQQTAHSEKLILKWRVFGIPESEFAQKMEQTLTNINCQVGYRWESPYIEFKVRCRKELASSIKELIEPLVKPHIISNVEHRASDELREYLLKSQQPISIFDEATGGLLQLCLYKPGLHHLLHFNNSNRTDIYFHISGLEDYWEQKPINGYTDLRLQYHINQQEGSESYQIPYRTPAVLEYATEWLSFRLLQIINQLH